MAALTGRKPGTPDNTYQMLLCVDHAGGIDNTARVVQDGAGNASCLSLATIGMTVAGTLSVSSSVTAASFSGSGASLTALNGTQVTSGLVGMAYGGLGVALSAPAADRILFYDLSAGQYAYLTAGSGLNISGTTLTAGAGGLSDGSYTDITVSGTATVFTIASGVVTYAKMQSVSAASRLLGRGSSAGAGVVQEIALGTALSLSGTTLNCTATGSGAGGDITIGGYASRPAAATAGKMYRATDTDMLWYDTGSLWDLIAPHYVPNSSKIDLTDTGTWTAVNASTSTVTKVNEASKFTAAPRNSDNLMMYTRSLPSAPYTATLIFKTNAVNNAYQQFGLALRESATDKVIHFANGHNTEIGVEKWTNKTTFSASYRRLATTSQYVVGFHYWRIQDDNTNWIFSLSTDGGLTYNPFHTVARNNFVTTAADQLAVVWNNTTTETPTAMLYGLILA